MPVWRTLFLALLSLIIFLAWKTLAAVNIETSLADVSPGTRASPQTEEAIAALQSSIEKRVILLVHGPDELTVVNASDLFRNQLDGLADITVSPAGEELAEQFVSGLADYRFSLLTASQQQSLKEQTVDEIARATKQALFSAASGAQLFPFNKDPLGWHSSTFLDLLNASQAAIADTDPAQGYARSILLNIERGAMNMRTQERLSGQIDKLASQIEKQFKVNVERSGVFFFAADAAMYAKRDISLISSGSILGVILLLLFAFGTLRTLMLPMVSIFLGVVFAFLVTHWLYGGVHVLTIVFGASLIGI
ncbi:MAG: MMPL family transporter, partial [Gammaproteobacteria bacterium]|nr:MMPL family transporter [Gammaproteobacteria bacterium]